MTPKGSTMKRVCILILLLFSVNQFVYSQSSVEIGSGASISVGSGADICADQLIVNGSTEGDGTFCTNSPFSNNRPTASNNSLSVSENSVLVISTANFGYSDADNDPLSHVEITMLPAHGTFWIDIDNSNDVNGSESVLTNNADISLADLNAGRLKYSAEIFNDSFKFRVNDGSEYSTSEYTITINVQITISGSGTSNDPYLIATLSSLYWLTQNPTEWNKFYKQTADIDASSTSTWDSGQGFSPIGNTTTTFSGTYDGDGFEISNLYINRTSSDYCGLFGNIGSSGILKNVLLTSADVTARNISAVLAGRIEGLIENCGVVGSMHGNGFNVGGLCGANSGGSITKSYANVSVTATGNWVGGFIGVTDNGGSVDNCYARGSVSSAGSNVGGFAGLTVNPSSIDKCYSTGTVSGSSSEGGFVGVNLGTTTNCFWDTQTSAEVYCFKGNVTFKNIL